MLGVAVLLLSHSLPLQSPIAEKTNIEANSNRQLLLSSAAGWDKLAHARASCAVVRAWRTGGVAHIRRVNAAEALYQFGKVP